jgi:hypothetical protein
MVWLPASPRTMPEMLPSGPAADGVRRIAHPPHRRHDRHPAKVPRDAMFAMEFRTESGGNPVLTPVADITGQVLCNGVYHVRPGGWYSS